MQMYGDIMLTFVDNTDEIYVSYQIANPSTVVRILMNYTGVMERYIWLGSANAWNLIWYTSSSRCDPYKICGSYSSCNSNGLPVCQCLPGFTRKSPEDWALRDTSGGCIRNDSLACANGTDGFMKLSNVILPDALMANIDASLNLDECQSNCLRNCSCTAYANSNVTGGGSGCVMWIGELNDIEQLGDAGQDLYIRLAAAELGMCCFIW